MTDRDSRSARTETSAADRERRDAVHALALKLESRARPPAAAKAPATRIRKRLANAESIVLPSQSAEGMAPGAVTATELFDILKQAVEHAFTGIPPDLEARIQLPSLTELPSSHDEAIALSVHLDRSSSLLGAEHPTVYAEPKALLAFASSVIKRLAPPRAPHRDPMIGLCVSALAHSLFPSFATPAVRKLLRKLRGASMMSYSFRNDPSPAFASITTPPGSVDAEEIFQDVASVYELAAQRLGRAVKRAATLDVGARFGLDAFPMALGETTLENRQVLRLAKLVRAITAKVQVSAVPEDREAMHVLRLVAHLLEELAPPVVTSPVVECSYCYRHGHTVMCAAHPEVTSRNAWNKYRDTLAEAVEQELTGLAKVVKRSKSILHDVYLRELNGHLTLEDAQTTFDLLFPAGSAEEGVRNAWADSLRGLKRLKPTAAVDSRSLAATWYANPVIGDPLGEERLTKPIRSVFFKVMHDAARLQAYIRTPQGLARPAWPPQTSA